MMSIVDEVNDTIKKKSGQDMHIIKAFTNSAKWFDELVERGIIAPRQNQIMPLGDQYRQKLSFNTEDRKS